jgi:hypothetical protein
LTGDWNVTGSLNTGRLDHTATLLQDGRVLVTGGQNASGKLDSSEIYDPATGHWSSTGNMTTGRQYHFATVLPNGKVLVAARPHQPLFGHDGHHALASLLAPWPGYRDGVREWHSESLEANGI